MITRVIGMIDPEIMEGKDPNKALFEFLKTVEFPYGNDKYSYFYLDNLKKT